MIPVNDENVVLSNIFNLMKMKGVRQTDLANYLGLSQNAITQWKTHKTRSYMRYLDQLAEYFDVSKDDLLHADKDSGFMTYLSNDELIIIHDFRKLSPNSKKAVSELIHSLTLEHNS